MHMCMNTHQPCNALKRVVSYFATQEEAAVALGVDQSTVSRWLKSGQIGVACVLAAEKATGISRHDLRPDIYPRETMTDAHAGSRFTGIDHRADPQRSMEGSPAQ